MAADGNVMARPTPCHILDTLTNQWVLMEDMHKPGCIHEGGDGEVEETPAETPAAPAPEEVKAEETEANAEPLEEETKDDPFSGGTWEEELEHVLPSTIDPLVKIKVKSFINTLLSKQQELIVRTVIANLFKEEGK